MPITRHPDQWRQHAVELHGRGLEMIDEVNNARDVSYDVVQFKMLTAQTFFAAAQSATAMAEYVKQWSTTP